MSSLNVEVEKNQRVLKVVSSIFAVLSYLIGLGTLLTTIYLLVTPRGEGAWILPLITFIVGGIVFLFLYSFSKVINLLIAATK